MDNGKVAVDSLESIPFHLGTTTDPLTRTFKKPCPSSADRIIDYDAVAVTTRSPAFVAPLVMPEEAKGVYTSFRSTWWTATTASSASRCCPS